MKSLSKLIFPSLLFLLLAAFLFPKSSNALTVLKISEKELYTRAEIIVVAKCVSIETREITDKNIPFTFIEFTIEEVLKGDLTEGETIALRRPGIGSASHRYLGPIFEEGEEVVLFLGVGKTTYYLIGVHQGKYPIVQDPETGKRLAVKPDLQGLATGSRLQNTMEIDDIREKVNFYQQEETLR